MTDEEWRPVVGFEGYYEVSSLGRVRSLDRVVERKDGYRYTKRGRILSPWRNSSGRWSLGLVRGGVNSSRMVHRLVAEAFIPNQDNLPWVLHWDDNPDNNHVDNLRWGTPSDNQYDRVRNGIHSGAIKTHCKNWHEFTPENTAIGAKGERLCRECRRENKRVRRNARKISGPPEHGTPNFYSEWGCRCHECKGAYSEHRKARNNSK